ncbi:MAG: tripartite tricarboxylate transporter TctB family protein [Clostridiales bacterium]|nr:tripartite tricarboxylate transporter TctB family protein [Clostridiales bacterium]
MKKKKNFSELVIGVACIALGVAVYIASNGLQKVKLGIGPGGFPRFVAAALVILGVVQTVIALVNGVNAPKVKVDKHAAGMFAAAVILAFAYVLLVEKLGFLLLTPILLIAYMYLFGERSVLKMAIIAIITTVCIWLLFTKVFMIFLPAGRIFS